MDDAKVSALEVHPGTGIGSFMLGQDRDALARIAGKEGLAVGEVTRWEGHEPTLIIGSQLQVNFENGTAAEIEAADPDAPGTLPIMLGELRVLREDAVRVLQEVSRLGSLDRNDPDYPSSLRLPTVGLAFWRDGKPGAELKGRFESVLVFPPKA